MTLRKFILLCLLLVSAKDLRAQDPRIQTRDSLRGCLATLPHDILRLQTYQKLILATQNNPDEYRQYNEELLAEAKLQKNDNYMCQAYLAQIIIAYNIYDGEKVHDLFAKMEPVARRSGNYNLLFRAWHCAIDVLLLEQDYQKNEREGLRMLQEAEKLNNPFGISEAYQALATLYKNTFRHAEAAELLEKALPLAIAQGQFNPVTNIRQSLLFIYHETQDFENWNRTLQEFEAYMQQQNAADPYMRQLTLVILYSSYLEYCNSTEDYVRGEHYLNLVEKYIQGIDAPLYEINFNSIAASYYRKTEQYEKALAKIDNALGNIRQGLVNDTDYHDFLAQKADMLHKMHRTKEALPLYKAVRKYRDSMQVVTIDKQYAQLKKDYKADTFLLEQATLQSRIRIFTIGLGMVSSATSNSPIGKIRVRGCRVACSSRNVSAL